MKDFSFQGKVYLATRLANGKPGALRWVDDASQLSLSLSTDKAERTESWSGNRLQSAVLQKAKKAEVTLKLNAFLAKNLALALYGTSATVAAGNVTGEALPSGLVAGDVVSVDKPRISSVVVKDSAGTPATLTAGTHYSIESADAGLIKIINVGTFVQPFKVDYANAAGLNLAVFTTTAPERYLVLDGINTVDSSRVRVSLYRVQFDPVSDLALINDEFGELELKGPVLYDATNALDANLGGFGRIELPQET